MKKCLGCGKLCDNSAYFCTDCGCSEFTPVKRQAKKRSPMGKAGKNACVILLCSFLLVVFSALALAFSASYSSAILNSLGFRKYERYSAKIHSAVNMFSAGKYGDAEGLYNDAKNILPSREEAYVGLANIYIVTGRTDKAVLAYLSLAKNSRDYQTSLSSRGYAASLISYSAQYVMYQTIFEHSQADISGSLEALIDSSPYNTPNYYELLGDVYHSYGRSAMALTAYNKAIAQYARGSAEAYIGTALIYKEIGDKEKLEKTLKDGFKYTGNTLLNPETYAYVPDAVWNKAAELDAEDISPIYSEEFPELNQFSFLTTSSGTGVLSYTGRTLIEPYENAFWSDEYGICTMSASGSVTSYRAEGDSLVKDGTVTLSEDKAQSSARTVYDSITGLVSNPLRDSLSSGGSYAYILPVAELSSEQLSGTAYSYNYDYSGKYVVVNFYGNYSGDNPNPSLKDGDNSGVVVHSELTFTDFKLPGTSSVSSYEDGSLNAFSGYAAVKLESGRWAYISENGKLLDIGLFDDAEPFSGGVAAVSRNGRWAYITQSGELLSSYVFAKAGMAYDSVAWVQFNNRWGTLNLRDMKSELYGQGESGDVDSNPVLISGSGSTGFDKEYSAYSDLCYELIKEYGSNLLAAVSLDMNGDGVDELLCYMSKSDSLDKQMLYESMYSYNGERVVWLHSYCVSDNLSDDGGEYWVNSGEKPHTWDGSAVSVYRYGRFRRSVYSVDSNAYAKYLPDAEQSELNDAICRKAQYISEFGEAEEYSNIIAFYMENGEIKFRLGENSPGYSDKKFKSALQEETESVESGIVFSANDSSSSKFEYAQYAELCESLAGEYGISDLNLNGSGVICGLSCDMNGDGCDELCLFRLEEEKNSGAKQLRQDLYSFVSGRAYLISSDIVCVSDVELSSYSILSGKDTHAFSSFYDSLNRERLESGVWYLKDESFECENCLSFVAADSIIMNGDASLVKKASTFYSALQRGHEEKCGDLSGYIPLISFESRDSGGISLHIGSSGGNEYAEADIGYSTLSDIRNK